MRGFVHWLKAGERSQKDEANRLLIEAGALCDEHRKVVLLLYFNGMTYRELALCPCLAALDALLLATTSRRASSRKQNLN